MTKTIITPGYDTTNRRPCYRLQTNEPTASPLRGMLLGFTLIEAHQAIDEVNANRAALGLPLLTL